MTLFLAHYNLWVTWVTSHNSHRQSFYLKNITRVQRTSCMNVKLVDCCRMGNFNAKGDHAWPLCIEPRPFLYFALNLLFKQLSPKCWVTSEHAIVKPHQTCCLMLRRFLLLLVLHTISFPTQFHSHLKWMDLTPSTRKPERFPHKPRLAEREGGADGEKNMRGVGE